MKCQINYFGIYYHFTYDADNNGIKYFEIQSYNETKKMVQWSDLGTIFGIAFFCNNSSIGICQNFPILLLRRNNNKTMLR